MEIEFNLDDDSIIVRDSANKIKKVAKKVTEIGNVYEIFKLVLEEVEESLSIWDNITLIKIMDGHEIDGDEY